MELKTPISVIIVTHNEEARIEDCLKSVSWAKEIILVDGSSTDRTAEIARKYMPKVFVKDNAPCETQRLFGLAQVSEPWFFLVDADERVSSELAGSIQSVIGKENRHSAYHFLRRNYLDGRTQPVHFNHPEYQLRLFRKSDLIRLPEKIHRVPEVRGSAGYLDGELSHYFFGSVTQYLDKINFYTRIEAEYCLTNPAFRLTLARCFIRPLARFIQNYFLKRAFLDGYWGLVFSMGSAYYEMLVNLRIMLGKRGRP